MAAPADMVGIIPIATETVSSTQTPIHGYTFEGDVATTVNIGDLKPIIVMANMGNVSEEVQVSTQIPLANQEDVSLSEGVLRSHLMASKPITTSGKHLTSEVYPDSETGVTYEIVRGGTTRGRDKLIDSLGFAYNMKQGRSNKNLTYWWCAVRNTHLRCPASVVQRGNIFMRGKRKHEHLVGQSTPKPHSHTSVKRAPVGRPPGSTRFTQQPEKKTVANPNYRIIKEGSKAGKDLLRDRFGYTYTQKKVSADGSKVTWRCSVRNSMCCCNALVAQTGHTFKPSKRQHAHLPGHNKMLVRDADLLERMRMCGTGTCVCFLQSIIQLCKDGRRYWICSIRNKHLRCPAMVIQMGNSFAEGSQSHKHMPGSRAPAGEHDVLPKMHVDGDVDDNFDDYSDDYESAGGSGSSSHNYHSYNKSTNSPFTGFGTTPVKKVSRQQRMFAKESKRKDHPTFLGPSCTINLTKCDDLDCNCKMVHCPFCDPSHFIPAKAGRVQDHLELTHFAHGVQYDDLMIVKCFQDCNLERNFGHYHCVFCCQQILKRNSYARHMLRHMRKLGIPDRLLVLPDSKFPDVINAYGYEIPVCKKVSCQPSHDKHYHCPQCQQVCKERSLTVNHLWRCLQRKADIVEQTSDDEEMLNTVDESQLNLHFSHVKSFIDLPLEKCTQVSCCNQMYHCRLCPPSLFRPTYRQHLIAHYVTHWKQRVPYKGYALLKCFQTCEGIDRRYFKTKFHFHCPICCKIILTKGSFEDHIKGCHMFKFGENLIEENPEDVNTAMEEDVSLVQELAPIHDNVAYMEDKLTAQAIALEEQKSIDKKLRAPLSQKRVPQYGGKFRGPKTPKDMNKMVLKIKQEMTNALEQEEINQFINGADSTDITEDIFGLNISENEIFDLGSVIFSEKFVEALKSTTVVNAVFGKVSVLTNTRFSEEEGRYILSGKLEDLVQVKKLLVKAINGAEESELSESEEESSPTKKSARKRNKTASEDSEDDAKTISTKSPNKGKSGKIVGKKGKQIVEQAKKGRGRPKKNDDSFPYSEIKEIIEASKKTGEIVKRGRGRPAKKLPVLTSKTSPRTTTSRSSKPEAVRTPSRYGTRGIKRNYVEMNSGNRRVDVKEEVKSENDAEVSEEEDEKVVMKKGKMGEQKKGNNDEEQADFIDDDDDDEDDDDENSQKENHKTAYLDDSEQEELDLMSSENEKEEADGDQSKEVDGDASKTDRKITESTVQGLKTSNVSTLVPLISKVGIRQVSYGKRKPKKETEDDQELEKMMSTVDEDSLRCSLCDDYAASSFSDMTQHLMTYHHVYEPPRCDVCQLDLDTYHTLTLHIDRKHGPKPEPGFKCRVGDCKKVFILETSLRSHVNAVHKLSGYTARGKRHVCNKCQFRSNSIEDLYEHKKVAHSEEITCEHCDKTFLTYQTLKSHLDLKHSASVPQTCTICSKQFSSAAYLQRHMKFHNMLFTCRECGKAISTKASLEAHMETHKPEEERNYKYACNYCGKKFFLKNNYEDHLNKHTGNRPYSCDLCDKKFGFRSMLKKHKTFVHSSERPFKCGFCMKGFKFMNLLKNHVTIHTHDSKHVCHCSKSFSTAQTLKLHKQKCRTYTAFVKMKLGEDLLMKTDNVMTGEVEQPQEIINCDIIGNAALAVEQELNTELMHPANNEAMNVTGAVPNEVELQDSIDSNVPVATTVEVYACSECRATFRAFKDAELHVLTAHSQVQTAN